MENSPRYRWGLFEIISKIHVSVTGAGPTSSYAELKDYAEWLQWRLDHWMISRLSTAKYDFAVSELVRTVLDESGIIRAGWECRMCTVNGGLYRNDGVCDDCSESYARLSWAKRSL